MKPGGGRGLDLRVARAYCRILHRTHSDICIQQPHGKGVLSEENATSICPRSFRQVASLSCVDEESNAWATKIWKGSYDGQQTNPEDAMMRMENKERVGEY